MGDRKKVLVAGLNTEQVPYIQAAKELEYTVIGTDINPKAPGRKLCDVYHQVSYLDSSALIQVGNIEGFTEEDSVFTAASHHAWEGISVFAERFGIDFPSPAAVDICLDKSKLYTVCEVLGIPYPDTIMTDGGGTIALEEGVAWWMKSDYGKSPKYCEKFMITDGEGFPDTPTFDQFYRRRLLFQQHVDGAQVRVNLSSGQGMAFLVFPEYSVPISNQGVAHWDELVEGLCVLQNYLGMDEYLLKFDIILRATGEWFLLDVGLDPPSRLIRYCEMAEYGFYGEYVKQYLTGIPMKPWPRCEWVRL